MLIFFFGQVIKRTIFNRFSKTMWIDKTMKAKKNDILTIWGLLQMFSHFTVITDKKNHFYNDKIHH